MRLWSLHPRYLDAKGLVALWRETLLAQAVLAGKTVGYRRHPQLERFRVVASPLGAISFYLRGVHAEASKRGYAFDKSKIGVPRARARLKVTDGQLAYERCHLLNKLKVRDPELAALLRGERTLRPHPSFDLIRGPRADWEKVGD